MGGRGAVAARARAELAAGEANGATMIGVTDSLHEPVPGLTIRSAARRSVLGVLPGGVGELAAVGVVSPVLLRVARELSPTVIVFHSSTLALPAIAVARRHRARSVFIVQALIRDRIASGANPYGRVMTRAYLSANDYALRHAERVVCVSRYMASVASAAGVPDSRLRVLPNPVALERFRDTTGRRDIDVLFVGRLSPEKGVDVLIRAVAGLSRRFRVVVAGDGSERPRLEALAAALHAPIDFLGWQDASDLPSLIGRARLQVVPSRSEPQGVVVLEALAAGTPVVGSRVGGIPEAIVDAENGWLVPPGDESELQAVLLRALSDPASLECMREAARRSVAGFGSETLSRRFIETYL